MTSPTLWSVALADIADPDYTQTWLDVLPAHATADPAAWARTLFSRDALPRWLDLAASALPSNCATFAVRRVEGGEALVGFDARGIDVRFGIGVDEQHALVRVVSTMRYKGRGARWRSLPLRAALGLLMRGMIARSRRELSGVTR